MTPFKYTQCSDDDASHLFRHAFVQTIEKPSAVQVAELQEVVTWCHETMGANPGSAHDEDRWLYNLRVDQHGATWFDPANGSWSPPAYVSAYLMVECDRDVDAAAFKLRWPCKT
jgi:hypothetical protein